MRCASCWFLLPLNCCNPNEKSRKKSEINWAVCHNLMWNIRNLEYLGFNGYRTKRFNTLGCLVNIIGPNHQLCAFPPPKLAVERPIPHNWPITSAVSSTTSNQIGPLGSQLLSHCTFAIPYHCIETRIHIIRSPPMMQSTFRQGLSLPLTSNQGCSLPCRLMCPRTRHNWHSLVGHSHSLLS